LVAKGRVVEGGVAQDHWLLCALMVKESSGYRGFKALLEEMEAAVEAGGAPPALDEVEEANEIEARMAMAEAMGTEESSRQNTILIVRAAEVSLSLFGSAIPAASELALRLLSRAHRPNSRWQRLRSSYGPTTTTWPRRNETPNRHQLPSLTPTLDPRAA